MMENKRYTENLRRAEEGDVLSMFFVAMSAYDGTAPGTHEEHNAIFEYWMPRAAALGYVPAYRYLGNYYSTITGKDKEAYEFYLKGADLGDAESAYQVAEYYNGNDLNTYFETLLDVLRPKAIEYYYRAYRAGHPLARTELLRLGENIDCSIDCYHVREKESLELANLGLMYYELDIGNFYLTNEDKKNPELGLSYVRRSADAGFHNAVYFMGFVYYKGLACKKDKAKALEWFRAALNTELIGYYDGCFAYTESAKMVEKLS